MPMTSAPRTTAVLLSLLCSTQADLPPQSDIVDGYTVFFSANSNKPDYTIRLSDGSLVGPSLPAISSPAVCQILCWKDPNCHGFVWINRDTCFFRGGRHEDPSTLVDTREWHDSYFLYVKTSDNAPSPPPSPSPPPLPKPPGPPTHPPHIPLPRYPGVSYEDVNVLPWPLNVIADLPLLVQIVLLLFALAFCSSPMLAACEPAPAPPAKSPPEGAPGARAVEEEPPSVTWQVATAPFKLVKHVVLTPVYLARAVKRGVYPPAAGDEPLLEDIEQSDAGFFASAKAYAKSKADSYLPISGPKTVMEAQLDWLMAKMGESLLSSMKDPYMPDKLRKLLDAAHAEFWDDIEEEIKESVQASLCFGDAETRLYNEMRLRHWAGPPRIWPRGSYYPKPLSWLRCKLLYATQPADATSWKMLRDPFAFCVVILALTPYYNLSVWMFVLAFFLIDKRDEYQLVQYILKVKTFQFLSSGVVSVSMAAAELYSCVLADSFRREPVDACAFSGPGTGTSFPSEVVMEPVRVGFIWAAFGLLAAGYAHGGKEEILALEQVRLDAADGSLDGVRDIQKLRRAPHGHRTAAAAPSASASASPPPKSLVGARARTASYDELKAATAEARKRMGAEVRMGGALPYFMCYDVAVATLCVLWFLCSVVANGLGPDDWQFWLTVYFTKAMYALLSFPFILFAVGGSFLTHAKPTGYDQAGHLCSKLTKAQAKKKHLLDLKAARAHGVRPGEGACCGVLPGFGGKTVGETAYEVNEAAERIQKLVRGKQARQQHGYFPVSTAKAAPATPADASASAAAGEAEDVEIAY